MTERRYLKNVTPKTLAWYEQSFKAFDGAIESEAAIKQRIVELHRCEWRNSWHPTWQAFLEAKWYKNCHYELDTESGTIQEL
jgi:hypothetical protein